MKKIIICIILLTLTASLFSQTLELAKLLTYRSQYDSASSTFKKLIQKNPNNSDIWFYWGKNLLEYDATELTNSKLDSAKIIFNLGISSDSKNPLNWVGLGIVNSKLGLTEASNSNFEKALKLSQHRNSEVLIQIAEYHISKKNSAQAFSSLESAQRLDRLNPKIQILLGDVSLQINDGSSAIRFYERALELEPNSALAFTKIGQLFFRNRNYSGKDGDLGAIDYLKSAIKCDTLFGQAYLVLGDIYSLFKMYDNAKFYYSKFVKISPGNLTAKSRYASFLYLCGDWQNCLSVISEIWQKDSSQKNLLNRLAGYSYYEIKDFKRGIYYIEKFMKLQPKDKILATDHLYYAKLLLATQKDSLAIESFQLSLKLDSNQQDVYSELSNVFTKQKDYSKSNEVIKAKIKIYGPTSNDFFRLGLNHYSLGNFKVADSLFEDLIESQPNLIGGHLWRARTNANLDPNSKSGLAKPLYEKVILIAETDLVKFKNELIESLEYLGSYYYFKKDFKTSKKYWQRLKNLSPDNKKASVALNDLKKRGVK